MPTIKAGKLAKGSYIQYKSQPHAVVAVDFQSHSRGAAHVRTTVKNVVTGVTQEATFKSNQQLEVVDISSEQLQFLYIDAPDVVLMNARTFEQLSVPLQLFAGRQALLKPELQVYIQFNDTTPIGVIFPPKITMEVIHANEAVAGNTVGQARKEIELETGLKVQAPIFISAGELVVIDSETMEYVSRA